MPSRGLTLGLIRTATMSLEREPATIYVTAVRATWRQAARRSSAQLHPLVASWEVLFKHLVLHSAISASRQQLLEMPEDLVTKQLHHSLSFK